MKAKRGQIGQPDALLFAQVSSSALKHARKIKSMRRLIAYMSNRWI